ncbi:MAG: 4Fe-4S dicluster domain-containing protein [Candidatus Baldrarchaeia archaeon]
MTQNLYPQKVISVDLEKCISCKACELACSTAHSMSKDLVEASFEIIKPKARIFVEHHLRPFVVWCRHCEDPLCMEACPYDAMTKNKYGIVVVLEDKCIACGFCATACPFGAIMIDEERKIAVKCDLCTERLKKEEVPACVEACPTEAIQYIERNDISKNLREKTFERRLSTRLLK